VTQAAALLGMGRGSLRYRLDRLQLEGGVTRRRVGRWDAAGRGAVDDAGLAAYDSELTPAVELATRGVASTLLGPNQESEAISRPTRGRSHLRAHERGKLLLQREHLRCDPVGREAVGPCPVP